MDKKLFVFGCSYSDRTGVKKAYGDYLAELTGLEYHHCAKGGTSNDRTWRMATRMIIDGEITPNDILMIQYTDRHRREFASYGIGYDEHLQVIINDNKGNEIPSGVHPLDKTTTECGTFYTSNYKMHSHSWQLNHFDRAVHKAHEDCTCVDQFDNEYFKTRHRQFEAFCEVNNINLVIYWCRLSDHMIDHNILSTYGRRYLINEENFISREPPHCFKYELGDPNDTNHWDDSHLSVLGHETVAKNLAEHLYRFSLI